MFVSKSSIGIRSCHDTYLMLSVAADGGVLILIAASLQPWLDILLSLGVNPQSVRGSRTGVFIGCSASEAHDAWTADAERVTGYEMTGCTRSMFANRLSYFFDFKGVYRVWLLHGYCTALLSVLNICYNFWGIPLVRLGLSEICSENVLGWYEIYTCHSRLPVESPKHSIVN